MSALTATHTRIALADLRRVAAVRPTGYYEEVTASGEIDGEYLVLENEVLAALRSKYGKPVTPRAFPVTDAEADRCRGICEQCRLFAEPDICLDPQCGCMRSEDRREPWCNRKTECGFWKPLKAS
jgi:hypothetical protein